MMTSSIFEMKTNLSKYVSAILNKEEPYIVLLKNGVPVAKLVPYEEEKPTRIGRGKGIIPEMPELEVFNNVDVEQDFFGGGII